MGCNNGLFGFGGNNCLWIIIILVVLFCCCGDNDRCDCDRDRC